MCVCDLLYISRLRSDLSADSCVVGQSPYVGHTFQFGAAEKTRHITQTHTLKYISSEIIKQFMVFSFNKTNTVQNTQNNSMKEGNQITQNQLSVPT